MPAVRMHASALSTTSITQDKWQVAKSFAGFAMDFAYHSVLPVHMQTIAAHHAQSGCLPFHLRTLELHSLMVHPRLYSIDYS